jgi:MFS family permease
MLILRVFFGWKVVATAFTTAVFSYGIGFYGPSVFLYALHELHGWTVTSISAAITTHFLISAAMVLLLADAHRRFGVAAVTRGAVVISGIGLLGWGLAAAPWQLFGAAVLTGTGYAATSGAAMIAMVSPWFNRGRAAALSHALNGASVGGIVFVPLWMALIGTIGFASASALVSAAMLAVVWPLAGRYLRPTPESMRLAPDGDPMEPAGAQPPTRSAALLRTLVRDQGFITLSTAFALALFAQIGLITHLVTRLAPALGDAMAASAVTLATVCAVAGRLLLAALIGNFDRRRVAAANLAMQACGAMLLAFGSTLAALLTGCVLLGLGIGNLISLPPLIAQAEFHPADVPRIVGLVTALNQAAFAFAPAAFGALRDAIGSYTTPFALAAAVLLAAGGVLLLGRGHAAPLAGNTPSPQ